MAMGYVRQTLPACLPFPPLNYYITSSPFYGPPFLPPFLTLTPQYSGIFRVPDLEALKKKVEIAGPGESEV